MGKQARRDVLFAVDATSGKPLYRQLYDQARDAILQGALAPGDKLPSIRGLAKTLALSHTTVEQAYLQLSVEGYVRNVPRSGYVVEALDVRFLQLPKMEGIEHDVRSVVAARDTDSFYAENAQGGTARYDFSYANLPSDSFPAKSWRRIVNEVLYANAAPELSRYANTSEPSHLCDQLAAYLSRARGVNCLPEQVVLQAGTDGALATALTLFDRTTHIIGMEEPGYATVREVASRLGFAMVPLPADRGADAFMEAVERQNPKIVFTTPSHQFPTGRVLSLEARTRLLKWAERTNAYIIEDDSCNEYRYDTAPIPSLQSLDAYQRVIYLCNMSKALAPGLRTAYLVLPPKLLKRYYLLYNHAHPSIPWLDQEVLARFIERGEWEQHVRRMSQVMRARHDKLLGELESAFGNTLELKGRRTGMHFFATVHNGMTQDELMASAAREGAAVYGTQRMWFSQPAPENHLMIGFSSIPLDDIPAGVAALKRAWLE